MSVFIFQLLLTLLSLEYKCTAKTRICIICNRAIVHEIADVENNPSSVRLTVLSQTRKDRCLICNAQNNPHRLSVNCRFNVFVHSNVYIPDNVRSCAEHLDENYNLIIIFHPGLNCINRTIVIKGNEMQEFLLQLLLVAINPVRYEDDNCFTDSEIKILTSVTKEQFFELFAYCDPVPRSENDRYFRVVSEIDLLAFLCKLRKGLADEFLQVIFNYSSRQALSLAISTVRQSLNQRFVPENIGFGSITRENYIHYHVTDFSNELYNPEPNIGIAIAYIDGTYAEIPKSSNFRVLRQSYSVHKSKHLVKPALVVAPDDYILEIQGPYFSDSRNNDAEMLQNEFERDVDGLRTWF